MRTALARTAALSATAVITAVAASAAANVGSAADASRAAPLLAEPAGPACADAPAEGDGSFADMALLPAGDAVASSPQLSMLAGALATANVVAGVNGGGPFTIFAPVDAAFERIPANVFDSILADSALLGSLLTYHVIEGEAHSVASLAALGTATSANGSVLTFADTGGTLLVNGSAAVVCSDIAVANGVVHLIDSVLQPPTDDFGGGASSSVASSVPNVTAVATPGDGPQGPACAELPPEGAGSLGAMAELTAGQAIASNPMLTQLLAALDAGGITAELDGEGPFTIFAPSNEAFAAIPAADLQAILDDAEQLGNILRYHVIEGESLTAADLATAGAVTSTHGAELSFSAEADGTLTIDNGQSAVTCSNISVANGTIHLVGSVLVPPAA